MSHPWGMTVLPVHMAKRMVENRGGEATERDGRLEIRRNGQFLYAPLIVDGCVNYLSVAGTLAVHT
ncbi:hypothetical protein GA0061099_10654 [Bradyrhizobium yuanmingense]|uniref:Uncharacterized protein n=1 Tax=Bradyrhizobium yuanmingense TaxID=108015 RepID=A0A1C3XMF7_9BRAD|nr:PQQ-dependent sugar dehydrogenase [Bradyrhizobium yuanmingense]TWI19012.1 hypothetical protein IQ15_07038 [Bradyrhizobium yuanmingense]SCB53448.1 hypothetical protein GA0061099_10654 [Bradyrhizobium yuanmingense]